MVDGQMAARIREGRGFIAALDQSGGSTPKALAAYGVSEDRYSSEDEMFDLIHGMRSRIVGAPAFTGDKVIGAILFEQTMDRAFDGVPAPTYLWEERRVVPFLKIDRGLEAEADGAQRMKPMPGLGDLLDRARGLGVFGTKARSVIGAAEEAGIEAVVAQQFEVAGIVLDHELVPILEPEITISIPDKPLAEAALRDDLVRRLDALPAGREVMLKLTLPEEAGFYGPLVDHPRVLRVVALSGGYSLEEATARLARNPGVVASFSRALAEGLSDGQDDAAFEATLARNVDAIHAASVAG